MIENYKNEVHIEPAMRFKDRIEGHILQGHIDAVGTILKIQHQGKNLDIFIRLKKEFIKFIVPKGSISLWIILG